jgi:hypothetical protein
VDPYQNQVAPVLADPDASAGLAEAFAATHWRRYFPTYYIKAEGEAEVDIANAYLKRFHPMEIKWTHQIKPKRLKQILKYADGRIWTQARQYGEIQGGPYKSCLLRY